MTQDEAQKVAEIIRTADNGCSTCVGLIVDRANKANLGFVFRIDGTVRVVEQPDWSDDPEDEESWSFPNVIAEPTPPAPGS